MHLHTGEDSEINQTWTQNQVNRNDWSEETLKKHPVKEIQTIMWAWLPLWPCPCVYPHIFFFYLQVNILLASLLFVCMWKFVSTQWMGWQGLATGHCPWWSSARVQCSHHPDSVSGWNWNPDSSCCRQRPPEIRQKWLQENLSEAR